MAVVAFGAGPLGLLTFATATFDWLFVMSELGLAAIFPMGNVMHGGVRLGRKVCLIDMSPAATATPRLQCQTP